MINFILLFILNFENYDFKNVNFNSDHINPNATVRVKKS